MVESKSWAQHIYWTKESSSQRVQVARDLGRSLVHPCAQSSISCTIIKNCSRINPVRRTFRDGNCRELQAACSCSWLSSCWKVSPSIHTYSLPKMKRYLYTFLLSTSSGTSVHEEKPYIVWIAYMVWHLLQRDRSCSGSMCSCLEILHMKKLSLVEN